MQSFEQVVDWLATALAVLGGVVLLAAAVVVCVSVTGRALPGVPSMVGDFELVEMAAAIAVFSFLPRCQLSAGQVSVDVLTEQMPRGVHAAFGLLGHLLLTAVSAVLLWRMWLGFGEKFPFGSETARALLGLGQPPYFTETTYELLIPVWIAHAACLPGAILLVPAGAVAVLRAGRAMGEART
ncbi:MAG: TRAP transporter small permease subunit [Pseudomonadota bacterium]